MADDPFFDEAWLRRVSEMYPETPLPTHDVYFLRCRETKKIKIGRAKLGRLAARVNGLMSISPTHLEFIGHINEIPGNTEKELHARFSKFHAKGEWFHATPELEREIRKLAVITCDNCCDLFLPDYSAWKLTEDFFGSDYEILCENCLYEEMNFEDMDEDEMNSSDIRRQNKALIEETEALEAKLQRLAHILKGPPVPPANTHDLSDLEEVAKRIMAERK